MNRELAHMVMRRGDLVIDRSCVTHRRLWKISRPLLAAAVFLALATNVSFARHHHHHFSRHGATTTGFQKNAPDASTSTKGVSPLGSPATGPTTNTAAGDFKGVDKGVADQPGPAYKKPGGVGDAGHFHQTTPGGPVGNEIDTSITVHQGRDYKRPGRGNGFWKTSKTTDSKTTDLKKTKTDSPSVKWHKRGLSFVSGATAGVRKNAIGISVDNSAGLKGTKKDGSGSGPPTLDGTTRNAIAGSGTAPLPSIGKPGVGNPGSPPPKGGIGNDGAIISGAGSARVAFQGGGLGRARKRQCRRP
jgi:hypothetical protein